MRFRVQPAPLWDRGFLTAAFLSVVAVWLLWPLAARFLPSSSVGAPTLRMLAALLVGFVVAWVWTRSHRRPGDSIDLTEDALRLPPAITGGAVVNLRFDQIRRVELQGVENRLRLVLSTQSGRQIIPAGRMTTPEDFLDLLNALLALAEKVPAPERMRLLATVEMALRAPPAPRPWVTLTLIALCLAVGAIAQWALTFNGAATTPALEGLFFGANQPVLVREGQWFRLVTANYLHGGVAHLVMNMLSLYTVGSALERMLGRRALLALYLFAGLTGALGSDALVSVRFSVGASTSLFGLVGALAVVHLRNRHTTPAHLLPTGDFWRNTLFMNALLVIAAPNIDHLGHLGGLLGGALLAWVLDVRPYQPEVRPHRRLSVAAGLLIAVHLAGLATAFVRGPEARHRDAERWIELAEKTEPVRGRR